MGEARITIPTNPRELIDLLLAVQAKHDELDKDSPLNVLDWKILGPNLKEANEVDNKITDLSAQLEILTQRRKILIEQPKGLTDYARSCRDVLAGVFRGESKKLGEFGFEVNDTPKAKKSAEKKLAKAA